MKRAITGFFAVAGLGASIAACSGGGSTASMTASSGTPIVPAADRATATLSRDAGTLSVIQGGGAVLPFYDYTSEITAYNKTAKKATVTRYLPNVDSEVGEEAFLNNDFTCDQNKSSGNNGGNCNGSPGGAATVHYAASDEFWTSSQISYWFTNRYGQPAAGNLIQVPSLGYGVAIPIVNSAVVKNGAAVFSDNDLCGIFSGKLTDFSQITDAGTLTPGPISVVYRQDNAGLTYTFTAHLSAVCNPSNLAPGFALIPVTTSFTYIFSYNGLPVPPNFVGVSGSIGIANYLSGLSGPTVTSAVAYLTPDFTSLIATSPVRLSNGNPSQLLVAAVSSNGTAQLPTAAAIAKGLAHPLLGNHLTAPQNASEGNNPTDWAPIVETTSTGYPMVGYTFLDFAQCYANAKITAGVLAFLKAHYSSAIKPAYQIPDGFAALPNVPATGQFLSAIQKNILANANGWNTNFGNLTACPGLLGR